METCEDDDIFIFGFSRGTYVARFLAEMLDHVVILLLSAGNKEMARFAWKTFARWQDQTGRDRRGIQEKGGDVCLPSSIPRNI